MTLPRSFVPLALLATAALAPAQKRPVTSAVVEFQVLVQGAFGDVVLNTDLLLAIAKEPKCVEAVRALGVLPVDTHVSLPVAHLAGTYQIFVQTEVDCAPNGGLTEEQRSHPPAQPARRRERICKHPLRSRSAWVVADLSTTGAGRSLNSSTPSRLPTASTSSPRPSTT